MEGPNQGQWKDFENNFSKFLLYPSNNSDANAYHDVTGLMQRTGLHGPRWPERQHPPPPARASLSGQSTRRTQGMFRADGRKARLRPSLSLINYQVAITSLISRTSERVEALRMEDCPKSSYLHTGRWCGHVRTIVLILGLVLLGC